ncbi:MAG: SDR family NAD(P)-dependent oxidoreductase [Candidatus Hodarchaeota archaeon]
MSGVFKGKRILITGGIGSIGLEIINEILKHDPEVVRVLDINETALFELKEELKNYSNLRVLLGDIRDKSRVRFAIENIDIVLHTASLKHVEICEYNPFESIKTNVIGTQNIIDSCIEEEVEKLIFTSSDKAVSPTNVMGATKLLAERLITSANYYKGARKTVFSSIRFGNVLGSRGSVIPLFKRQIEMGGPITITDGDMTRFIMPMRKAIYLLLKAVELAQGGEIFIFKMSVIRISDLAEVMIEELASVYGYSPTDVEIKVIGSKPGEKLHEALVTEYEASRILENKDMFILLPEMESLSRVDKSFYPQFLQGDINAYSSKDIKPLSKEEIRKFLQKESLL